MNSQTIKDETRKEKMKEDNLTYRRLISFLINVAMMQQDKINKSISKVPFRAGFYKYKLKFPNSIIFGKIFSFRRETELHTKYPFIFQQGN